MLEFFDELGEDEWSRVFTFDVACPWSNLVEFGESEEDEEEDEETKCSCSSSLSDEFRLSLELLFRTHFVSLACSSFI